MATWTFPFGQPVKDVVQTDRSLHLTTLAGKEMAVLPLAHPRHVAKLGQFSQKWYNQHQLWLRETAGNLLKQ